MAEDLYKRLNTVDRLFTLALDLHSHTDLAAQTLMKSGKVHSIERVETDMLYQNHDKKFHLRSREFLDFPQNYCDLIVSLLSLQLTNDTPGVLSQIKNILKPDGLFLAVMAGVGTLSELRECLLQAEIEIYGGASPRIYPFADIRAVGALLQRVGFALPVADIEDVTIRYDTMFDLINDLRAMGMQNALINRSRRPVSKRFFSVQLKSMQNDLAILMAVFARIFLSFGFLVGLLTQISKNPYSQAQRKYLLQMF